MNDSQYNLLSDSILLALETAIEECGVDIDYEGAGGLLTLTFVDGSKIIVNKQEPLHQIWVATKFNGHHFHFENEQWVDKRGGGELWKFLSDAASKKAEENIVLSAQ